MNKVLIYKDTKRIGLAKDFFTRSVKYIQSVYDKFRSYGVRLELTDLCEIIKVLCTSDQPDIWLINYLAALTPARKLNPSIANDLRSFITSKLPNGLGVYNLEPGLIYISNDKVTPVADALTIIENRFCFYAENETGADLGKLLYGLSSQLNQVNDYLANKDISIRCKEPVGIVFTGVCFMPDISFIRTQERIQGNTRLKKNTRTLNL